MNSCSSQNPQLCSAGFNDCWTESLDFFEIEAIDVFELRERLRVRQHDASQSGRSKDEKLRDSEFFGFGLAPVVEALIEGLLVGSKGVNGPLVDRPLTAKFFDVSRCGRFRSRS